MLKKYITLSVILAIFAPLSWASDSKNSLLHEEVLLLKQRLVELEQRLEGKEVKTNETNDVLSGVPKPNSRIDFQELEQSEKSRFWDSFSALKDDYEFVSISGNIDVLGYHSDQNTHPPAAAAGGPPVREDTSDMIVDQLRLNFDIDVSENFKAFVGLQFETDLAAVGPGGGSTDTEVDGNLQVDVIYVTISSGDSGLYAVLGKQYMPFGNVTEYGNFISDTLTRQMYETRDTGAVLGLKNNNMDFSLFTFNGQFEQLRESGATADNKLDTWGVSLVLGSDNEDQNYKLGISYINNIYQAQNTTAVAGLGAALATNPPFLGYADSGNGGINVYSVLTRGPLWISAEWVTAVNKLERDQNGTKHSKELGLNNDTNLRPQAYTFELGLTYPIADREYVLAAKYEASNDLEDFGVGFQPVQDIWGIGVSSNIYENTRVTLNYENWDYVDIVSGSGGGGHANVFLAELSVSF
jgi:hypothetical protein